MPDQIGDSGRNGDGRNVRAGIAAFLYTQFALAFNDNLHFSIIAIYLAGVSSTELGSAGWQTIVAAAFMAPFVLFSPIAGAVADRFSKRRVLIVSKWFEPVPITVSCISSLLASPYRESGLVAGVFLMELQSAFFSPAKYGIVPEIVAHDRLVRVNGLLEMFTMVGIVSGQAMGGISLGEFGLRSALLVSLAVSVAGSVFAFYIPEGKRGNGRGGVFTGSFRNMLSAFRAIFRQRVLLSVLIALSVFWMVAALFRMNIPVAGRYFMKLSETYTGFMLASLSVGIAAGSALAGFIRSVAVSMGFVLPGAVGMGVMSALLWWFGGEFLPSISAMFCLGIFGGLYLVPQYSLFQASSPEESRGSYVAALNFSSFSFMFAASAVFWVLTRTLGIGSADVFLVIGILLVALSCLMVAISPGLVIWTLVFVITRVLYRTRIYGLKNIPKEGGALIAPNHITLVDSAFLLGYSPRPLRFLIERDWFNRRLLKPFFEAMGLIPVAHGAGSKGAIVAAVDALRKGDLVVIFPEGEMSRTGSIGRFRHGIEMIAREAGVPIIPVHMDRLWGSIFSYQGGRYIWKVPREIPFKVTVTFGEPMPSDSSAFEVRQAVMRLASKGFRTRLREFESLGSEFISTARRNLFSHCMSDSLGVSMSYYSALVRACAWSRVLGRIAGDQKMIGLMFPPSVAGALCNVAAQLAGKIAVNLNWTVSRDVLAKTIEKSGLKVIITSKAFIEQIKLTGGERYLFIEDIIAREAGLSDKIFWSVVCAFLPAVFLKKLLRVPRDVDNVAAVIFSSGTTGDPKGVMLTHANVLSNLLGISDLFTPAKRDRVLGALPFFHSFGFAITLWLPLLKGMSVAYHHSPVDAAGVGRRALESRATLLASTATFLNLYAKCCTVEQFASLRHVIVGAERLQPRLAMSFAEKFGIMPLEGYGCTELSPVVSVNIPDVKTSTVSQTGTRLGTIGRPLPGIAVKIVNPDTFEELKPGEEGLLLVHGSNVMAGYLNDSELTAQVIRDGWYVTGDIAKMDEDGFLSITDRISRFSKIGGEMVPHVKIEELIQEAMGIAERCVVVTSVPDEGKGERLVVLHSIDLVPEQISDALRKKGLPSLWVPRPDAFIRVREIPILGSGKVDLAAARRTAEQLGRRASAG